MTEQARPKLTDALIEWMLAQRAGPGAPADLIPSVTAAIESTGQRAPGVLGTLRGPAGSRTRRGPRRTWLLVAATLLVGSGVVGASFIGGRLVTPNPAPTMPALVTNPTAVPYGASSWTATGSMITPRSGHTATLLPAGMVLVAGGESGSASAELYDPRTGSWTATGSMNTPRILHTATLLPDGKVLVAGGYRVSDGERVGLASVELYDPSTGSWTATGSMNTPRFLHAATLLPDGRVLVAGGDSGSVTLASAELYDPSTGSWAAAGSMHEGRAAHAAVLLSDARVLVAGGADFDPSTQVDIASAELYDIGTGSWTAAGDARHSARAATLLPAGKVLAGSSLFDPGTGSWTATRTDDNDGTATLLRDGRVLVGGATDGATDLYDPGSGSWVRTGSMVAPGPGALHTATLLPDGRVLVAGGSTPFAPTASAELYDPGSPMPPASVAPSSSPAASPSPVATIRPAAVVAYIKYMDRANPMAETGRVWIVGSDGIGAHELFPDGIGEQSGVAWSPDGTRLVYSESGKLYLTDANGREPQLLDTGCVAPCSDTEPAFSPDATRLVFRRNWVIATMDLASGRVTELASTAPDYNERPRWSPDGKQIVFSRQDKFGNGSAVFVVDLDGRNLRQLSSTGLSARLPDWSPDGSRIVFTSLVIKYVKLGGNTLQKVSQAVYTVRPDWTDLRRLTTTGNPIGATWTPDGRILFATECRGDCAANGGLWTIDADGSNPELLVPGGSGLDAALWGIEAAWQPTP